MTAEERTDQTLPLPRKNIELSHEWKVYPTPVTRVLYIGEYYPIGRTGAAVRYILLKILVETASLGTDMTNLDEECTC